ncbi:MAG TPA: hypothetical protein VGV93_03085, partial [Acidimicrobiales bacterium]|nr:hypothetical protein [Acidimicrobiales bacterium]
MNGGEGPGAAPCSQSHATGDRAENPHREGDGQSDPTTLDAQESGGELEKHECRQAQPETKATEIHAPPCQRAVERQVAGQQEEQPAGSQQGQPRREHGEGPIRWNPCQSMQMT